MRSPGSSDEVERRRHRAVQRVLEGYPIEEVADFLGVPRTTVSRWVSACRTRGILGLAARPATGRPPKLTRIPEKILRRWLAKIRDQVPRLKRIWADGSYEAAVDGAWSFGRGVLDLVRKPKGVKKFVLLPHRWVVERTFAWLSRCRRLSQDYERLTASSEAMIHVAMIRLMLRRLIPA